MTELSCYTYSLVSVPLYDTLGTEAIAYIIDKGTTHLQFCKNTHNQLLLLTCLHFVSAASISTIVCDVPDKVNLVLDCCKDAKHAVKTIVLMEAPSADLVKRGQQAGIHILSLQEMEVLSFFVLYTRFCIAVAGFLSLYIFPTHFYL